MPDINGLELCRFVRRSEPLRSLPIVIISTQSTSRDVDRALHLGAQTFVAKPFTGLEGRYVKIKDTVRSFDAILKGECDEVPESYFFMKGTIDEVFEAYEKDRAK
jgi:F0F1-type ATP synthase beta subunit